MRKGLPTRTSSLDITSDVSYETGAGGGGGSNSATELGVTFAESAALSARLTVDTGGGGNVFSALVAVFAVSVVAATFSVATGDVGIGLVGDGPVEVNVKLGDGSWNVRGG